jgi:Protein of unknown function (DUF2971).
MIGYKFRSFDDNNHWDAISNGYIWASTMLDLNDPYESLIDFSVVDDLLSIKSKPYLDRKFVNLLAALREKKLDYEGVFSCSKIWDNELMWAHYANAHRGFCVEYDIKIIADTYKHSNPY